MGIAVQPVFNLSRVSSGKVSPVRLSEFPVLLEQGKRLARSAGSYEMSDVTQSPELKRRLEGRILLTEGTACSGGHTLKEVSQGTSAE